MAVLYRYTAFWSRPDGSTAYWAASFTDNLCRTQRELRLHLKQSLASGHPHFVDASPAAIVLGLIRLSAADAYRPALHQTKARSLKR